VKGVGDDTPVVIEKLKRLRNLNYGERPVSLYGGMVDLPLWFISRTTSGSSIPRCAER
jgi:hypothetical protein